MLKTMTA